MFEDFTKKITLTPKDILYKNMFEANASFLDQDVEKLISKFGGCEIHEGIFRFHTIFIGGKDEMLNYEIIDMEVYWELNYQLYNKIRRCSAC